MKMYPYAEPFPLSTKQKFGKQINYPSGSLGHTRHVPKHVPGRPATVVQNMPGAGMLIAAKYTVAQAKPDGLTMGHWMGALILQHVMGNPAADIIDGRKIGWVGAPLAANSTCVFTRQSGIKTVEDWLKVILGDQSKR